MTKSIVEKLNLQKYKKTAVLNIPPDSDYLTELTFDKELLESKYDLIFGFVLDLEVMKTLVKRVIEEDRLEPEGYMYLAYPKKGNKKYASFIHRDELLAGLGADEDGYIGNSGIKFARMVGMDDVFTVVGLKEDAKNRNKAQRTTKPSQRVDDYEAMIPQVEQDLQDSPEQLAFYCSLTPGYRKDWARYVYSAKQESTRDKRREEMKMILGAGYKSKELFRAES